MIYRTLLLQKIYNHAWWIHMNKMCVCIYIKREAFFHYLKTVDTTMRSESKTNTPYVKDWATEDVVTKAERRPIITALLYVLGSVCIVLFLESMNVSFRNGPPTNAPVATLGFGWSDLSHLKPSLQPVVASAGIEAPLWWTNCGYLSP